MQTNTFLGWEVLFYLSAVHSSNPDGLCEVHSISKPFMHTFSNAVHYVSVYLIFKYWDNLCVCVCVCNSLRDDTEYCCFQSRWELLLYFLPVVCCILGNRALSYLQACPIGPEANILEPSAEQCHRIWLTAPVLSRRDMKVIKSTSYKSWKVRLLICTTVWFSSIFNYRHLALDNQGLVVHNELLLYCSVDISDQDNKHHISKSWRNTRLCASYWQHMFRGSQGSEQWLQHSGIVW